ncbi:MAG: polyhydroxyalkanoate depolymerase, partial [Pseudomonadota bacterium]|nr:polyhydroxyalkanoate depolymerase [Pseudomonadota bacterium]
NYLQNKVGHFGVFNGSRFRNEIVPRIREFHASLRPSARAPRLMENS